MGHNHSTEASPGLAMYASAGVRAAMASAAISRGHATLLCALRKETQEAALGALLGLPSLPGVEELKRGIQAKAVRLSNAAFDQEDCGTCRFNSTNHEGLFGASIEVGMCVNQECATSKWMAHTKQQRERLEGKHRIVKIASADDGHQFRAIDSDGPKAVGRAQASVCRSQCPEFGAVVVGSVSTPTTAHEDVCTNVACHGKKVEEARIDDILTTRDRVWRDALVQHLAPLPRALNRALLMAMLSLGWSAPAEMRAAADLGEDATPAEVLKCWLAMEERELMGHTDGIAVRLIARAPSHQVGEMLRVLRVKLQDYSSMSPDFLRRLSVAEIDVVLSDLGVPTTDALRKARRSGQEAYAAEAAANVTADSLAGYVPPVFRY